MTKTLRAQGHGATDYPWLFLIQVLSVSLSLSLAVMQDLCLMRVPESSPERECRDPANNWR